MSQLLKEYKIDGTEHRIVINYSKEYPNCFVSITSKLVKPELDLNKPIIGVLRQIVPPDNEANIITFEIVLTSDHPHSRSWYIGDIPIPNIGLMIPEGSIDPQVRVLRIRDLIASNLLTDITPQVIEEPKLTLRDIATGPYFTVGPNREDWKELSGLYVAILQNYDQYPGDFTISISDDKKHVIIKDPVPYNIPDIKLPLFDYGILSGPWGEVRPGDLLIIHNPETSELCKCIVRSEANARSDSYYPDRPRGL
jgi:hypothetical protein